jgi:hypothetical protein
MKSKDSNKLWPCIGYSKSRAGKSRKSVSAGNILFNTEHRFAKLVIHDNLSAKQLKAIIKDGFTLNFGPEFDELFEKLARKAIKKSRKAKKKKKK